jgi:hypothetical protein
MIAQVMIARVMIAEVVVADVFGVFQHLIGNENLIDVPRSCALVIQAITSVEKVTSHTGWP